MPCLTQLSGRLGPACRTVPGPAPGPGRREAPAPGPHSSNCPCQPRLRSGALSRAQAFSLGRGGGGGRGLSGGAGPRPAPAPHTMGQEQGRLGGPKASAPCPPRGWGAGRLGSAPRTGTDKWEARCSWSPRAGVRVREGAGEELAGWTTRGSERPFGVVWLERQTLSGAGDDSRSPSDHRDSQGPSRCSPSPLCLQLSPPGHPPPVSALGFLGIQAQQGFSDPLSLSLALGYPFPSQPQFPGTPTPHDSSGGHKRAGSCPPGPPPPPCHPVTHTSLGVVGQQIGPAVSAEAEPARREDSQECGARETTIPRVQAVHSSPLRASRGCRANWGL